MKYVAVVTKPKILHGDRMLTDPNASPIGDNLFLPFVRLANVMKAEDVELHTSDMMPVEKFDAFFFYDMPGKGTEHVFEYAKKHGKPTILHVWENHFIAKGNADFHRYKDFDVVLTYNDEAVEKYGAQKLNYAFDFAAIKPSAIPFSERKFAVMISACMKRNTPHNISYLRLRALNFYAANHPDKIDLYGRGWDKGSYKFQDEPEIFRFTHALFIDKLLPRVKYPFWKGPCERKSEVIGKYKFVYCYENTDELPGYITEKIFDAIMSGAVPVYLNHPASLKHIPEDCYINRLKFVNDEALYAYLDSITEAEWLKYREAGIKFLATTAKEGFSIDTFCKKCGDAIRKVLK